MAPDADLTTFRRTLPLFDGQDRAAIQRLLHHTVSYYDYDHPDRKLARDVFHAVHEGEGIRLLIGPEISGQTLVVTPSSADMEPGTVVARFVEEMETESEEWVSIAENLGSWLERSTPLPESTSIAFEYLY